jgi:hypothetical protein
VKPGSSLQLLKAIAILGGFAICALTPAIASAATSVPPGATEGDQYFEEVPNGGGSGSVNHPGGSVGGPPAAATQALNALGPDGQAAAGLANSNKPSQQGPPSSGANANAQPSSSTEGEGGMGSFFPILLVITGVAAIAYGVRRRLNPA